LEKWNFLKDLKTAALHQWCRRDWADKLRNA